MMGDLWAVSPDQHVPLPPGPHRLLAPTVKAVVPKVIGQGHLSSVTGQGHEKSTIRPLQVSGLLGWDVLSV